MSKSDEIARLAAKLPGVSEPEIIHARREWTRHSVMRRIIAVEADRLIEVERTALETVDPEVLKWMQGKIAGIKAMLAAANAQGDA